MGRRRSFLRPKWPTWLHLGGPRPSQIEAKTSKNRCWKSTRFRHRFLKGLDLVLEGFLDDFWKEKCTKFAQTCFSRKPEKHWFSLRGNWYFQGFDAWKYQRFGQQWHKKLSLLWNIDLGWIFEGFWDGFGRPKSFIFQLFSMLFEC